MIEVYQGDSFSVNTPVYNTDGTQKDLSDVQAYALIGRKGTLRVLVTKDPVVVDNEFVVTFAEQDTIDLSAGDYTYQLRTAEGVVLTDTIRIKPILKGV